MATPTDIDRVNSDKKETEEVTTSETSTQKNLPPPFIIYAETNEECIIDDDFSISIVEGTSESDAGGAKKNKRRNRRNRHRNKKGLRQELENLDSLVLPEGIVLVEDGTYIGFQCTYCNCVMSSLKTVEEHAGGNPHKQKFRSKAAKGEDVAADSAAVQLMPSLAPKEDIASSNILPSTIPIIPSKEMSLLSSKSSLNKFLLKTKEPIVGLDHVIEVQLPGMPPTFRCSLCITDCDSDGIKDHVIGTRHRLSYLRIMDTQKVAEMLALNLKKAERNKRTVKYTEELQALYGPGTIQITDTPLPPITVAIQTETKASAHPQAAVQPGNNPPIIIWEEPEPQRMNQDNQFFAKGMAQKRPGEGGYPPWKRQSMGRGFQGRRRYNNRRQGNYFDRRQPIYRDREGNFSDQYHEGRQMNREQYGKQSHETSDQHINISHTREQYENKSYERNDQCMDREPNKAQDGNKPYEKSDQQVDREPNTEQNGNKSLEKQEHQSDRESKREQHGNKQFERRDQPISREANRERSESWRSYSDDHHGTSIPNRPQTEQHLVLENPPNNEDLRNIANNPMNQMGNGSANMQAAIPPPPLPPGFDMSYPPPNYQEVDNQNNRRGRGRGNRFNVRNRGSSFSRSTTNRFSTPSRFETSLSSGFNRLSDFGRPSSFRSFLSDPLSNERDRLKMKYPGLRLGR